MYQTNEQNMFSFACRFKEKQAKLCFHSPVGEKDKMRLTCAFFYYLFVSLACDKISVFFVIFSSSLSLFADCLK